MKVGKGSAKWRRRGLNKAALLLELIKERAAIKASETQLNEDGDSSENQNEDNSENEDEDNSVESSNSASSTTKR